MLWPASPFHAGSLHRRSFLKTTASLAAAAVWASRAEGVVLADAKFPDDPFSLGVASGDPSSDGFVLWTRLAPKPLEGGGMPKEAIQVSWQIADDEAMTKVVQKGAVAATPDWGHSVHVEVKGLEPDRWYFYRFKAGDAVSPVGRARTFPAPGALPDRLRFAFASCQHFESGHFTAYDHMTREDLDLVIHLGDYIYEYKGKDNLVRKHVGDEIETLDDYRNRHAQYKTDRFLQETHRRFPWLVTWDDHEFDNNCAGDISEEPNVRPVDYLRRRANAYQGYYESMPLRKETIPQGPHMKLYRTVAFGPLARFYVLDTRQYRTDQPCGDGNKEPCEAVYDPKATLLGDAQEKWLTAALSDSPCRWNVLAQQVMMARVDRSPGENIAYSMDQWPGYEMNRRRILKTFHERRVSNPIVIAGDIHTNWANELIADFDDLDSRVVGSEFVGTSISSGGDGKPVAKKDQLLSENPFVKFHDAERGYVRCEVTPSLWTSDFRRVQFVSRPDAPIVTSGSYVVENGKAGVSPA